MNFPHVHSILHSQVQEQTTEFIFWRSPPSSPSSLFLSSVVKSLTPAGFHTKCGLLANLYPSIILQLLEIYCCCKFDKSSTLGVIFQRSSGMARLVRATGWRLSTHSCLTSVSATICSSISRPHGSSQVCNVWHTSSRCVLDPWPGLRSCILSDLCIDAISA